jgi:hypothetical protein
LRVGLACGALAQPPLAPALLEALAAAQLAASAKSGSASPGGELLGALEGLDVDAVLHACGDAAEAHCPLLLAAGMERARRLVLAQQSASWRQAVSGAGPSLALYSGCAPLLYSDVVLCNAPANSGRGGPV